MGPCGHMWTRAFLPRKSAGVVSAFPQAAGFLVVRDIEFWVTGNWYTLMGSAAARNVTGNTPFAAEFATCGYQGRVTCDGGCPATLAR